MYIIIKMINREVYANLLLDLRIRLRRVVLDLKRKNKVLRNSDDNVEREIG